MIAAPLADGQDRILSAVSPRHRHCELESGSSPVGCPSALALMWAIQSLKKLIGAIFSALAICGSSCAGYLKCRSQRQTDTTRHQYDCWKPTTFDGRVPSGSREPSRRGYGGAMGLVSGRARSLKWFELHSHSLERHRALRRNDGRSGFHRSGPAGCSDIAC